MLALYSFIIFIYGCLIHIAALFDEKARALLKGRQNQNEKIQKLISEWPEKNRIWIHAASYGEFEMAKPIIAYLNNELNDVKWIFSFHSPSGFEQHNFDSVNILKIYIPLDLKKNQNQIVSILKPNAVIFIKYEFWFNLLQVLSERKVPYFFSSMHLNEDSYLLRRWTGFLRKLIKNSHKILAHNPSSQTILEGKGFDNVIHFGDSRIDQVLKNKLSPIQVAWPDSSKPVICFGSIGKEDFEMVAHCIDSYTERNIILAPHDVDISTIQKLTDKINASFSLFSKEGIHPQNSILIIDTMGDLKNLYASSSIAYIGGGFKKGPHNILEPLVFGNAVITGPNIHKFPMARYLKSSGLLHVIERQEQLARMIGEINQTNIEDQQKLIELFLERNKSKLGLLLNELKELGFD